jgi:hypothetical protein
MYRLWTGRTGGGDGARIIMRKKRPCVAKLDQVRIRREADGAVIEHVDPSIAGVHLQIGAAVQQMTDQQVLDLYNDTIRAQQAMACAREYVAVEIPEGKPQIRYCEPGDQWAPRGHVLRCLVDDGGSDGELTVTIDDHELSLEEFGRLLCTYAGWGMRITFVPEDEIGRQPIIAVREVSDDAIG